MGPGNLGDVSRHAVVVSDVDALTAAQRGIQIIGTGVRVVKVPAAEVYRARKLADQRLRKSKLRQIEILVGAPEAFLNKPVIGEANIEQHGGGQVRQPVENIRIVDALE